MRQEVRNRRPTASEGLSGRSRSKGVLTVLFAALAVVIAVGVAVALKESSSSSGKPAAAVKLKPWSTALKSQSTGQNPQSTTHKAPPTTTPSAGTAQAQPSVPAGWNLAFNSDFSGSALDTSVWATCYYWAGSNGCTNYGNNGTEKEWYLPSQVQVSDGALHLVAQHEATDGTTANGQPESYSCRSGMVTTNPGFNFEYGLVQIVASIPYGNGLWPALWLAASNHAWPPEIDLLEHWESQANVGIYLHPSDGIRQGGRFPLATNLSAGLHTFTLSWTPTRLTWWYDGAEVFTTTTDIPQQAMYIVANVADTSTAASSCSGTMLIQSVKVWQQPAPG
jgi:beta-glucanase (GH16 family)